MAQSNGTDFPGYLRTPGLQPRLLRIVGIGAGASGLLLAYKVQRNFRNFDLKIFEKNAGVGGTWWENNYPGCACDNFSHNYTYSFEPKTDYEATYSTSEEIRSYFNGFYQKYGLDKYVRISHSIISCIWDDSASEWAVTVKDIKADVVETHHCDVLVSATGVLNSWKWPDVPGLDKFKGALAHSAAWDPSINLKDKTVALIGNGSSAIQILPAILPQAQKVVNLVRSPAWISTPFGNSAPRRFTEEEKAGYARNPDGHLKLRKEVEATNNGFFKIFLKGSAEAVKAREIFSQQMRGILDDEKLSNHLVPAWPLGCRRLTPGVGYLEALKHPKTTLVHEALAEVTETSVKSASGREFDVDVIICASGFDTSFRPKFPLVGRRGEDLRDLWKEEPKGYLGVSVPDIPNYFTFLGPNCPIGNGPVLSAIEAQGDYICKALNRLQTEHIKSMSPTMEAADEFMAFKDVFFQTTVWSENCQSWYKLRHNNKIAALWVGSTIHYLRAVENPRWEDWNISYQYPNRWSYLGNGLGPDDVDPESDLAYYIKQHDDSPILGSRRTYGGSWAGNKGDSVIGLNGEAKENSVMQEP